MRVGPTFGDSRRAKLTHEELAIEAAACMRSGRLLSKPHLAAWLDVSDRYIETEVDSQRLVAIKKGRGFVRFRPADIERWLTQYSTAPPLKDLKK